MTPKITNLQSMRGMGILADRDKRSPDLEFRRYNLIYGFNGSGKSTLSRIFASLEAGTLHPKLPQGSSFEMLLGDRSSFGCPSKPSGLEKRLLVFNEDYIDQNLQWTSGHANPVFFIGLDQTDAAGRLEKIEEQLLQQGLGEVAAETIKKAAVKNFTTFKKQRAKDIAQRLHLGNRKYEAPAFAKDYDTWAKGAAQLMDDDQLKIAEDTRRLAEPMPRLEAIEFDAEIILKTYRSVTEACSQSLATVALAEVEKFPDMLLWLKEGYEFHDDHNLENCLLCGSTLSTNRKETLAVALDNKIDKFVATLTIFSEHLQRTASALSQLKETAPRPEALGTELRATFNKARTEIVTEIDRASDCLDALQRVLARKLERPASPADTSSLPAFSDVEVISGELTNKIKATNATIAQHNETVRNFLQSKNDAETAIRKHFIVEFRDEYATHAAALANAEAELTAVSANLQSLNTEANDLKQKIRAHGPAAGAINSLIASYLGHNELTIHPIEEGYQLRRHGRPITGPPSEGEKTAIAISYFLSSIEAEGRKLKDVIVVIDDPVSSLDTRALNYACALIRNRLDSACQLFILTHNQQCMNEFRTAWKRRATGRDGKEPTATFLFIDVTIPEGEDRRSSKFVGMSRLLREYDSEYHYLFDHILRFSNNSEEYYEHGYMMPNVLRRVLDVFLAFKCPGSSGLAGKIDKICTDYPDLQKDRITALERLSQVESHSDNLDDLLSFSSMTLEETSEAASALLTMIEHVDAKHLAAVKHLCR